LAAALVAAHISSAAAQAPAPKTQTSTSKPQSSTPKPPPQAPGSTAPKGVGAAAMLTSVGEEWKGDLDGMIKRRRIRVLVPYSKTSYFIDRGVQRGVAYDMFKAYEDSLNLKHKTGDLRVHVAFIPTSRDALADALFSGKGDIVAGNITITEERRQLADFTESLSDSVREVLVVAPGGPAIATLDDLAGQTVHVRAGSIYETNLKAVSDLLAKSGKKAINVKQVPANLEDEDILEMANAGLIQMTVVDDHIARFWKQIFPKLAVKDQVAIKSDLAVGYAMRKNSPLLKADLDAFVKTHRQGTAMGNVMLTKYLKSTKFVKSATSKAEIKKFQDLIALFRKYGDQYGVDWVLMAAQGYQESQLKQNAKSQVGAIGIMQVMPDTGKDMRVGDISQIEPNINAGIKYVHFMIEQFFKDEPMTDLNKALFAFASYNAGPGRVKQLRREAAKTGLDPNIWFNNVERIASKRIGRETVTYVSNIYKYYVAYTLSLEEVAERQKTRPTSPQ
jgi:membrane-bound lytic murein transglycosylase MltF